MEERDSINLKETIRTLIRFWLRNKVSNNCDAVREEEFEDMWNSKPIFAGRKFHEANEALFNFVACSDSNHFSNFEDSHCIKMRENRHAFYSFVHSFAEKPMDEIKEAVDGLFTAQKFEEEKEEGKKEDSDSEEEINTHQPLFNVNINQLIRNTSSDDEGEVVDGWTWNTLLKSVALKEIVASSNIYKDIIDKWSKICNRNHNYIKNIVIKILKELREYYFKALCSTAPEEINISDRIEVLSKFSSRPTKEIRSSLKDEEVKAIGKRIRAINIVQDNQVNVEEQEDRIFNTWMQSQHLILNTRIPIVLQKLFNQINRDQILEENINELAITAIEFLDNPSMFEYLNDNYEEDILKTSLFLLNMNHEEINTFINNKKKYYEQNILKHISNLIVSNKNISFIEFRNVLWLLLKKSKNLSTKLLRAELAKHIDYHIYDQKNIELNLILKESIESWKDKFLMEISNHSIWGLCFRIISNTTGMKYIDIKSFERDMLVRIKAHERKFIDYGNEGRPWVKYKYKTNNYRNKRRNQNNPNNEQQIIGFYAWSFWYSSFRTTKGNTHPNFRKREEKYDRQFIKNIEFDFSGIPNAIGQVSTALMNYIQYGILYTYTQVYGRLRTFTLWRDTKQILHNGQLDFIKGKKKLVPIDSIYSIDKIEEAVNWLKRNNHLSAIFPTIYESEEIRREMEVSNINLEDNDDNYITIYPAEMDREFQENQIIEKLGRKFVLTDDIPNKLKDQRLARSKLYRSFKSVIFYNDEYLEEKLFVHLFPTGTGGYNSTFSKWMPLNQYARMRLLSGYTDKFRSDNRYIFFLFDWIRKKRIYNCNNGINLFKLNEVNKELLQETYEYKEQGEFDYYEKLGSKMFAQIKHSQEYKAARFYEIQALLQKFGKPELFVTVWFNHKDDEITTYIKEVFKAKEHGVINFNNYPVEFALFYKKKVSFVRNLLKPNNETPSIFGRVKAYVDTLEYTKTGIPHLHILLWLHDEDKQFASIEGNNLVFASAKNPRGIQDDELNQLINENQIHYCLDWKCNTRKNGAHIDKCISGYPHQPTDIDYAEFSNSAVHYARGPEDAMIVPYNPEFLKLMKWSTNVQIVNSENIAIYMSKYITVTRKDYIRKGWKPEERERQKINPVETYLKEKRITIIEAAMELINSQSYWIYPKLYNLKIRLPNERLLKLLPFKQIRNILDGLNDSQETNDATENDDDEDEEEPDNEILENILAPSMWENYMARNTALEDLTIIEMISKYTWCGNENSIPKRCIKPEEREFFKQWSFSELEDYRI